MTTFGVDIIYNSVGITDYFVVIMPHILRVTTGRYGTVSYTHLPDETMQIVPDERLFLETDDSLLDIEDILCQAARVRGVEVEALCERCV